jgi:hypothetical protein
VERGTEGIRVASRAEEAVRRMITWKGIETTIQYNSDLSRVEINGQRVNGYDLLDFVANWVRDRKITDLEDATTADVLGFNPRLLDSADG